MAPPPKSSTSLSKRRGDRRPVRCRRGTLALAVASLTIIVAAMYGAVLSSLLRGGGGGGGGGGRNVSGDIDSGGRKGSSGGEIIAGRHAATMNDIPNGDVVTIAHAVSLIKCSKGPSVTGFLDAAAVLRHSIHRQSVHFRPPDGGPPPSRYGYKMFAIVHPTCRDHATVLERLGYETLVRDHPVKKEDIQGKFLRDHIEGENCCGAAEFIKLYAYQITDHPIVVHWDMDVAVLRPLDDMYDAMLYPSTHPRGMLARKQLERQHPDESWPERIDAFFTRDITSAQPWEKITAVQGGFLVARPDPGVFDAYIEFIKKGDYSKGRGVGTGWGSLGYGGFQGAMAYQGAVAYYYDHLQPGTSVELNICRWNQVAADVIWRGPERMKEHHLQCREHPRDGDFASNTKCEDCRTTPMGSVNTVHYTACKKPWECRPSNPRTARDKRQQYRLDNLVNLTTCMNLFREWFELRQDFEDALERVSGGKAVPSPRTGKYEEQYFMGNCRKNGDYVAMNPLPETFDVREIYGI